MKNLKWGTKVKTTELAIEKHIFPKHRQGICLGSGKNGRYRKDGICIIVVCKGQVTPRTYHPDFWVETS